MVDAAGVLCRVTCVGYIDVMCVAVAALAKKRVRPAAKAESSSSSSSSSSYASEYESSGDEADGIKAPAEKVSEGSGGDDVRDLRCLGCCCEHCCSHACSQHVSHSAQARCCAHCVRHASSHERADGRCDTRACVSINGCCVCCDAGIYYCCCCWCFKWQARAASEAISRYCCCVYECYTATTGPIASSSDVMGMSCMCHCSLTSPACAVVDASAPAGTGSLVTPAAAPESAAVRQPEHDASERATPTPTPAPVRVKSESVDAVRMLGGMRVPRLRPNAAAAANDVSEHEVRVCVWEK
jgi:hypothetical protein